MELRFRDLFIDLLLSNKGCWWLNQVFLFLYFAIKQKPD